MSVVEKLCQSIADKQHERIKVELLNMETRLIQRIDQGLDDRANQLQDEIQVLRSDFEAKAQQLEESVRGLDDNCQAEIQTLNDWMQEVSNDIDSRVDLEVEDRVTGIRLELEDFVKDELRATGETLKQHISEANVYIEFRE